MKDVGMLKPKKHANKANIGPKIKQTTSISPYISTYTAIKQNTKSCTYVGLYGSSLFNFGSYVSLLYICYVV